MLCYREYRKTHEIVSEHAKVIRELSEGEGILQTVSDHDAEDNETLRRAGISTVLADKRIIAGVDAVKKRLRETRLVFYRHALVEKDKFLVEHSRPTSVIEEMPVYRYKPLAQQVGDASKDDLPLKQDDDGCDCVRYMVLHQDRGFVPGISQRMVSLQGRV